MRFLLPLFLIVMFSVSFWRMTRPGQGFLSLINSPSLMESLTMLPVEICYTALSTIDICNLIRAHFSDASRFIDGRFFSVVFSLCYTAYLLAAFVTMPPLFVLARLVALAAGTLVGDVWIEWNGGRVIVPGFL